MVGIELIKKEREEQILNHRVSIDKDQNYVSKRQLSYAASILLSSIIDDYLEDPVSYCPENWNIDIWEQLCNKSYKERLIIAGSYIAAELDRLDSLNA